MIAIRLAFTSPDKILIKLKWWRVVLRRLERALTEQANIRLSLVP